MNKKVEMQPKRMGKTEAIKEQDSSKMELERISNIEELSELFSTESDEWELIKQFGESHHKTGGVEPIDLYKSGGILKSFAIGSIIKYAFRNRNRPIVEKDLDKIIHYAQILRVLSHEEEIIK